MNEAVGLFWRKVGGYSVDETTLRAQADGHHEMFVPTPFGTLEIEGRDDFVSIACGRLSIEDRRVASREDADLLLSICDALIAGRAEVRLSTIRVELRTRGYLKDWIA